MIWFCSDNGPEGSEDLSANRRHRGSTGGLRGRKRSLFNGGVGVPTLVKWPCVVVPGSEFSVPCSTLDYFPTIASRLGYRMPDNRPLDGIDILPILRSELRHMPVPIPYRFLDHKEFMFGSPTLALMNDEWKFLTNLSEDGSEDLLFNLARDIKETTNVIAENGDLAKDMRKHLADFIASCRKSHAGGDYSEPYEPVNRFQEITGTWE